MIKRFSPAPKKPNERRKERERDKKETARITRKKIDVEDKNMNMDETATADSIKSIHTYSQV